MYGVMKQTKDSSKILSQPVFLELETNFKTGMIHVQIYVVYNESTLSARLLNLKLSSR